MYASTSILPLHAFSSYGLLLYPNLPFAHSALGAVLALKDKQGKGTYTIDSQEHEEVKDIAN